MAKFFNDVLNACIRNVDYSLRIIVSVALFAICLICFIKCLPAKNDKQPIRWGMAVLSAVSCFLSVIYVAL